MSDNITPSELAALEASIRSLNDNCQVIFQAVFRLERNFQTMLQGLIRALGSRAKELEDIECEPILTDQNSRSAPAEEVPKTTRPKVILTIM